jgi:hypothetical protein
MAITINGTGTITGISAGGLPDAIITQSELVANVASNGPAFFVRPSASQTVTSGVSTKIQLDTEDFDTNSNFDTSTYKFTPTVAGYYQISCSLRGTGTSTNTQTAVTLYKNGSPYINAVSTSSSGTQFPAFSTLIYMNGTTDYIEFYGNVNGTGTLTFGRINADNSYAIWASGCLVRSA